MGKMFESFQGCKILSIWSTRAMYLFKDILSKFAINNIAATIQKCIFVIHIYQNLWYIGYSILMTVQYPVKDIIMVAKAREMLWASIDQWFWDVGLDLAG